MGVCQVHGAPRDQGQDRWWLDSEGLDQEPVWQDREQEEERLRKEEPLDCGSQEGTRCPEDQGLLCNQEGQPALLEGEGVLQALSAVCQQRSLQLGVRTRQLQVWGFPQLLSVAASSSRSAGFTGEGRNAQSCT